jgi:hypothetical protein
VPMNPSTVLVFRKSFWPSPAVGNEMPIAEGLPLSILSKGFPSVSGHYVSVTTVQVLIPVRSQQSAHWMVDSTN